MDIQCASCHKRYVISGIDHAPKFCPFCGALTNPDKDLQTVGGTSAGEGPTLVNGHVPEQNHIQFTVGSYQVINSIGKGGMGEVFLAYDLNCGRRIALKRIRSDLQEHKQMHNRFLKEARVTSQLTHPAIIPIYAIHQEESLVYYTMPFVEGLTLRQILKDARQQEKKGIRTDLSNASIPSLVRIFLSVCQAVAYAHSKHVLHRDLKPENIIVGTFGEVMILDWGLAKVLRPHVVEEELNIPIDPETEKHSSAQLTHVGRVVGTVAYMAPERALGQPANWQTDIYSLGVILYQILTLRYPFRRGTLKEFRQTLHEEVLHDPVEVAPYRDVPPMLSSIALKCLTPYLDQRYRSVQELIHDIENYIEGRSEWFKSSELNIDRKTDWEFQENVLLAEHIAITRGTEISDWVSLMISKESFPGNTKIEGKIRIGEKGHGIGFLLSIPEVTERVYLNDGYCLWIGSDLSPSTKLLRSTVEVVSAPEVFLVRHEWYRIRIEKIDNNIYFYLNDVLQLTYISHMPLVGTHLGLLSRDADFQLSSIKVSIASQNIKVNCLAVPDAFLAHKDYGTALSEYRRIGYSFPGRAEGREALFRAGITLLEQANSLNREDLYEQALDEFGKMHRTPGAPLEYLGKSLVYKSMNDYEEEIKCFELAFRRYPQHPLLPVLQEQIIYRLHESSRAHRKATYEFMLLVARHIPNFTSNVTTRKLYNSMQKHWEPLEFFLEESEQNEDSKRIHFILQLAFWLAKPYVIVEIIQEKIPLLELSNALFCLIELGSHQLAREVIEDVEKGGGLSEEETGVLNLIKIAIEEDVDKLLEKPVSDQQMRVVLYLMKRANDRLETSTVYRLAEKAAQADIEPQDRLSLDYHLIWAYLLDKKWNQAGEVLQQYPVELLNQETTPLHVLYGCWLLVTEGKEIANIHFAGVFEVSFPRSWSLLSHYMISDTDHHRHWLDRAFMWEKRYLYRQLYLYHLCAGEEEKAKAYSQIEKLEYV